MPVLDKIGKSDNVPPLMVLHGGGENSQESGNKQVAWLQVVTRATEYTKEERLTAKRGRCDLKRPLQGDVTWAEIRMVWTSITWEGAARRESISATALRCEWACGWGGQEVITITAGLADQRERFIFYSSGQGKPRKGRDRAIQWFDLLDTCEIPLRVGDKPQATRAETRNKSGGYRVFCWTPRLFGS